MFNVCIQRSYRTIQAALQSRVNLSTPLLANPGHVTQILVADWSGGY